MIKPSNLNAQKMVLKTQVINDKFVTKVGDQTLDTGRIVTRDDHIIDVEEQDQDAKGRVIDEQAGRG